MIRIGGGAAGPASGSFPRRSANDGKGAGGPLQHSWGGRAWSESPRRRGRVGSARVRSPLARGKGSRLRRSRPQNCGRAGGECRRRPAFGACPGLRAAGRDLPPNRPPRRFRLRLLRPAVGRSCRERARRPLDGSLPRRDVRRGAGKHEKPVAGFAGRGRGSALRDYDPPHFPKDGRRVGGPSGPGECH